MFWLLVASTVLSGLFAAVVAQQYLSRRRPHQLAWAIALSFFGLGTLAAALGIMYGWSPMLYRTYYLFGAVINVPVLAAGSIYLLAGRRFGHAFAVVLGVACIYAAGAVFSGVLDESGLAVGGIPHAKDVLSSSVRLLSRYYSTSGFAIVVSAALWSAWRLSKSEGSHLRSIARANILIALGTSIVAGASRLARLGDGEAFAIGLTIGIAVMFAGFLAGKPPRPPVDPGLVAEPPSTPSTG